MPTLDRVVCLVEDQVQYWKVFSVADQAQGSVHVCMIVLPVVVVTIPRMSVWLVQVCGCVCAFHCYGYVLSICLPCTLSITFICTVSLKLL